MIDAGDAAVRAAFAQAVGGTFELPAVLLLAAFQLHLQRRHLRRVAAERIGTHAHDVQLPAQTVGVRLEARGVPAAGLQLTLEDGVQRGCRADV
jgi:hypothetical protein